MLLIQTDWEGSPNSMKPEKGYYLVRNTEHGIAWESIRYITKQALLKAWAGDENGKSLLVIKKRYIPAEVMTKRDAIKVGKKMKDSGYVYSK